MHAKQSKGTCNRPVNQWRLLQELKPVQRAVTQSPLVSMPRAICAWMESTSSIRDGGEIMQPRKIMAATATTIGGSCGSHFCWEVSCEGCSPRSFSVEIGIEAILPMPGAASDSSPSCGSRRLEGLDGLVFVFLDVEHGVELGDLQQIVDTLAQVHQLELTALIAH